MENYDRLHYALEKVTDKSVFIIERSEWERIIDNNGEPIKLRKVPASISGLTSMASIVMAAGSGIYNPSPGIDIVRSDPNDAPYVFNIDHYTVFENFTYASHYQDTLRVARIEESEELNIFIQSHVFVVGPYQQDDHWVEEIPIHIREAKYKD